MAFFVVKFKLEKHLFKILIVMKLCKDTQSPVSIHMIYPSYFDWKSIFVSALLPPHNIGENKKTAKNPLKHCSSDSYRRQMDLRGERLNLGKNMNCSWDIFCR